jgi:phage terminase large subunit-like protein
MPILVTKQESDTAKIDPLMAAFNAIAQWPQTLGRRDRA